MPVILLKPTLDALPQYIAALEKGWSPNNLRPEAASEQLAAITQDAPAFVASLDDPEARGKPVKMPDGSEVPRLPGFNRWIWDGEFNGLIGLRWQRGTPLLPPHVLGHIGFTVVPRKQRRGYGTRVLALLLPEARSLNLPYVELTTEPDNLGSQKVIQANGGILIERFIKLPAMGGGESLRFRIEL